MTDEQRQKITDLGRCVFLPGSYHKRFIASMRLKSREYELTKKQTALLNELHHRYRKQIDEHRKLGWTTWNTD